MQIILHWFARRVGENMRWKMLICVLADFFECAFTAKYHKCQINVTNNFVLNVFPLYAAVLMYFYITEMTDLTNPTYFCKYVVIVGAHSCGNLAPHWLLEEILACKASTLPLSLVIKQSLIVQDKLLHASFPGWLLIHWGIEYVTRCKKKKGKASKIASHILL